MMEYDIIIIYTEIVFAYLMALVVRGKALYQTQYRNSSLECSPKDKNYSQRFHERACPFTTIIKHFLPTANKV